MRHSETNPFREATLPELARACNEAVGELEERRSRTREEKEAFACRLRFLLLAVALRFRAHETIPGSPEMALRGPHATVPEAFLGWYASTSRMELQAVRRLTLWRAADLVLGSRAYGWLEPGRVLWSQRRGYIGTQDDEALARALRELDELRRTSLSSLS